MGVAKRDFLWRLLYLTIPGYITPRRNGMVGVFTVLFTLLLLVKKKYPEVLAEYPTIRVGLEKVLGIDEKKGMSTEIDRQRL